METTSACPPACVKHMTHHGRILKHSLPVLEFKDMSAVTWGTSRILSSL